MRVALILFVLIGSFISARGYGESMIGPGRWIVDNVMECDDGVQYRIVMEISRKKLNRTHDCFQMKFNHEEEFKDFYGIELDVYKEMDGGFKYYQYMKDDSACNFIYQYAQENFQKITRLAGIIPPECPVPPGAYEVDEFVFNYSELKDPAPYGSFQVNTYLVFNGERVSCLKLYVRFENVDDDDDK